jgi:hypothetical protein
LKVEIKGNPAEVNLPGVEFGLKEEAEKVNPS